MLYVFKRRSSYWQTQTLCSVIAPERMSCPVKPTIFYT